MSLPDALALCTAAHAGSLLFWFGAPVLGRLAGLAPFRVAPMALRWAAVLTLVTTLAWPLLQAAVAYDDSAAALDMPRVAVLLGQTHFGRIWLARAGLIAAAFVLRVLAPGRVSLFEAALVGAALGSLALLGHAAGVEGAAGVVQQGVLALHLLAVGAWVGALPVIWHSARTLSATQLAAALRRFSRLGAGLVALVLASGAASAWWRTGSVAELLDGDYGRWLAVKVVLVALMGVAALRNRNHYTPALEEVVMPAREQALRTGLRRSLAMESALGAVVVLVAALLGAAEAAR